MEQKRWYDNDPVVKLAVNLLEKSSNAVRDYASDFIIERSKNSGYILAVNNFEYFWQRWQDNNIKHFLAMEYLKLVDDETKREICTEVVKYIQSVNEESKEQ
ncbi:MAG: hypothetical protein LUE64_00035 [Candidatus Gastranaerophilales bacterium]|nr:hypothetical protein [Candidatus Gastranaerophilales bacterium]